MIGAIIIFADNRGSITSTSSSGPRDRRDHHFFADNSDSLSTAPGWIAQLLRARGAMFCSTRQRDRTATQRLPQSCIQPENGELETHRVRSGVSATRCLLKFHERGVR
jgi:hypothetical protein